MIYRLINAVLCLLLVGVVSVQLYILLVLQPRQFHQVCEMSKQYYPDPDVCHDWAVYWAEYWGLVQR